jgi:hypothetical protein
MSLRDGFLLAFSARDREPLWLCPYCASGRLLLSKQTLHQVETAESAEIREGGDWEPDWLTERFVAIAICNACGDPVTIAGEEEIQPSNDFEEQYRVVLAPKFVRPAPIIVPRPDSLPESVRNPLIAAEGLFWSDQAACANAIRSTVEAILTDQRVKKSAVNKKGKRVPLTLHSRIDEFGKKRDRELSDKMLAVKWIGNAGSHAGTSPTVDDLFDGFDLLHNVLDEVYAQKSKRLATLAKQIRKAKGPLSRGRRLRKK